MSTYILINNYINYSNCSFNTISTNGTTFRADKDESHGDGFNFNTVYDPDKDLRVIELKARVEKNQAEVRRLKEKQGYKANCLDLISKQ